jgi:hypothetical protein
MERRNRSLEAITRLQYIDSLNDNEKAINLLSWADIYLKDDITKSLNLDISQLHILSELFYKNINFIKIYRTNLKKQINNDRDIKKFLF